MTNRAPLFVGELNPYGQDPRYALFCEPPNSSGGRLCRLICGLRRPTYIKLDRVNLCRGKWGMKEARDVASALEIQYAARTIVLLGQKVAKAFGYARGPFSISESINWPEPLGATVYVSLPHPSGLCRAWSEPGAFERARALLREVCPDVPWGEALERRTA